MSDFSPGELPIRSQLPGQVDYDDVITKLGDATNPTTQQASVDTFGSQSTLIKDVAGAAVTTLSNGGVQALQVNDQSAGPVAPGTAANFSELIGGQFNTVLPTLTNGQQSAIQLDSSGRLFAHVSNLPVTVDTNYGVVGASTIRTAAEIGNATGAADFNFGAVGAQTLRTASELGNAAGAIDYNNGLPTAQTIRVAAQLAVGGANVSNTNPVPVSITSAPVGNTVNDYNTAAAVAAGATSNHIYTITALKTFQGKKIWASASGALKIEVQVSPDGLTYSTLWVGFNSASDPNISIDMNELVFLESGVGSTVRIIRTNQDKKPMDVYSTISGTEV